jgi:hypothetical protein
MGGEGSQSRAVGNDCRASPMLLKMANIELATNLPELGLGW